MTSACGDTHGPHRRGVDARPKPVLKATGRRTDTQAMSIRHALRRRDPFQDLRESSSAGELRGTQRPTAVDVRGGELVAIVLNDDAGEVLPTSVVVECGLEPDPFDTWDSNAVHVTLDGRRVGRMISHDAARFAPMLHEHLWRGREVRTIGTLCPDGRMFLAMRPALSNVA